MVVMVTCPNGHRFPVNPEKHQDRNYRFCPRKGCGAKVAIRRRFEFLPNSSWPRIKEEFENTKLHMKELKRQGKDVQRPVFLLPSRDGK